LKKSKKSPSRDNRSRRTSTNKSAAPLSKTEQIAIEGKLEVTKAGYGFVVSPLRPDQDVMVRFNNLNSAMNKDIVLVQITAANKSRAEGKIVKVIKRNTTSFIGTIHVKKGFAFVLPDKKYGMQTDIFIPIKAIAEAKDADRVLCEITDYNEKGKNPVGRITEVLTENSLNQVMWKTILLDHGFTLDFPPEVLEEVKHIKEGITPEELAKRKDYRKVCTFTIDPADAKDFDDAISFQQLPNGNYEIGIHIADVSHFVKPGTELDKFAAERATSVYLVDGTLPMLPEKISNELCSLRPNEDKYCFAAIFEMNKEAEIVNEWFGRTIIHSDKRFTYEEAQVVLETKEGPLAKELETINKLAYILRKEKFKKGAINFDTVETRFKLDETGKPIEVILKVRKDSNLLIEDFMLLANKQVATFAGKKMVRGKMVPLPYRVHDSPDLEKLKNFNLFAKQFGYKLNITSPEKIAASFNEMIEALKGKPEEGMLVSLGIRCMAKAIYTIHNIGHYGLAFPYYCHFTSPIRRYPDILTHRILQELLLDTGNMPKEDAIEILCKHSSDQEKQASDSERSSIKFMQTLYLKDQVGKVFEGVISGVTAFGIFVELIENKCEGMVATRNMDESFTFEETAYRLTGKRTGKTYTIGDRVKVLVAQVTPDKREVDFEFIEAD